MPKFRTAIVGAGNIAEAHATALLNLKDVSVVAVADTNMDRAKSLAGRFPQAEAFPDVDSMLQGSSFDCAHVLVQPDLHATLAAPLLEDGKHVLLEKPIATTTEEARALYGLADRRGCVLSVNHNYRHFPGADKFFRAVTSGKWGEIQHISASWNRPLKPLDLLPPASTWMLRSSKNLVLEGAVHPLSVIVTLGGAERAISAVPMRWRTLSDNSKVCTEWLFNIEFESCTASLRYSIGASYDHSSFEVIMSEGRVYSDFRRGLISIDTYSRGQGAKDILKFAAKNSARSVGDALRGVYDEAAAILRPGRFDTPWGRSMYRSISEFYAHASVGQPHVSQANALSTIRICEAVDGHELAGGSSHTSRPSAPRRFLAPGTECDLVVLGGTGYIAVELMRRALEQGLRVRVLARDPARIPSEIDGSKVELVTGDITSQTALDTALSGARAVVDTTVPRGRLRTVKAIAGMAKNVAESCLRNKVELLVYLSTIDAHNMRARAVIEDSSPVDVQIDHRNSYARGKVEAEKLLAGLLDSDKLPVCIMRPGVVVGGEGHRPLVHPAVGLVINGRHVNGFAHPKTVLPWVLVGDVADAVLASLNRPVCIGKAYNLVGQSTLSIEKLIGAINDRRGRKMIYHQLSPFGRYATMVFKGGVKVLLGRESGIVPHVDIRNKTLKATFDASQARADLHWHPETDDEVLLAQIV